MRLIDISPAVEPGLNVWPGDTPPSREVLLDMRRGDNLTLSTLHSTVHVGAHLDAPSHYGADAPSIDQLELGRCVGPCHLVRVEATRGARLTAEAIDGLSLSRPRVLIHTGSYDPRRAGGLDEGFAGLSRELVERLADAGVRLIGVDAPSVDLFDSKDLPAHKACLARDVTILEGLVLDGVAPGDYELIALPLRLTGFDASPVRAVLVER